MVEREIKLRFASVDEAARAVRDAGATRLRGRRLQADALLDTADRQLARRGCTLRVRVEESESRVTFKGPVEPGVMKVRPEIETTVGDGRTALALFAALGFTPAIRCEKYREELSAPGVVVAIDETPMGVFVEIEGREDRIAAMAAALGRSEADYIRDSYLALFQTYRDAHGLGGRDMRFGS